MIRSFGLSFAGAAFILSAAVLFAARHIGAATIVATKTGDQPQQYQFALQAGAELLPLSIAALVVGVALIVWSELRAGPAAA